MKIKIYLNEFEPIKKEQKKFNLLCKACEEYMQENKDLRRAFESNLIEINYYNEDFKDLFPKLISEIRKYPSLVYLDQNGIQFLSDKYLLELEKTKQTDFLYFVSASYFWRLGETEEFKKHVNIDMGEAKKDPYRFIHRNIIGQLRKKLPIHTNLKLYPFSLKKGTNIHGIIFGASHPRAVDKFLNIAWKRNPINGDANFDIDRDVNKNQLEMFGEKKLTKIEEFQENFRTRMLGKNITSNFDALQFVYEEGHIANHAVECIKQMKKKGEITYDGYSPLITYDNVHKYKKKIEYIIL